MTGAGCDSCNEGSCAAGCDDSVLEPCWGPRRPLFCIGPTGIWVKADYLQWWERGTYVPALATSGPTPLSRACSASRAPWCSSVMITSTTSR